MKIPSVYLAGRLPPSLGNTTERHNGRGNRRGMQSAEKACKDNSHISQSMIVLLKVPSGDMHRFVFKAIRRTDEYRDGEKVILTLTDTGKAEALATAGNDNGNGH